MLFRHYLQPSALRSALLNLRLTCLALSACFLCVQSSLTGVTLQKSDQLPDQVESQPLKQGKFVFRGRKRILSQNKRWGANPFPCAAKQSLHSLLSKWHLIWFCCWSFRYPECFQDIYSVCCATLARYDGGDEIWWAVTHYHAHTHKWRKTSWNKTTRLQVWFHRIHQVMWDKGGNTNWINTPCPKTKPFSWVHKFDLAPQQNDQNPRR